MPMSDDLVKRLRDDSGDWLTDLAADRIEELEAKLEKAKIIIDAYGDDQSYIPKRVVGIYREVFPDGTDDE